MAEDAVGDFARAMADSGLPCDRPIIADGRIHRYRARNGKRENEYYVLYQNGVAAGAYGSHRTGEKYNWREQRHTFQTSAERSAFKRQIAEAQRLRDEAIAQAQAKAAERARRMLTRSREADPKHPYLVAKGITPHCAKQIGRMLVLPIRDIATGVIVNLQFILEDGTKWFLKDGRVSGCAILLGERGDSHDVIYEAEGFATSASIRQATNCPTAVGLSDTNLTKVARAIRPKYPAACIIVCADDDCQDPKNPGKRYAREAAAAVRGTVAVPRLPRAPHTRCDFNDVHQAEGLAAVSDQLRSASQVTSDQRAPELGQIAADIEEKPVEWLWEGRIARGKLNVIDGDPSAGKSALTLDIAARSSDGRDPPDGTKLQQGRSIFLCSEDDGADTVVPRLRAAGANLHNVRIIPGAVEIDGELHPITLPDDILMLEKQVRADGAISLIIDPFYGFISDAFDTHKDASIRRVLGELAAMAQRTRCAIVLIRHLNKQSTVSSAMYRGGGSIAVSAAARAAYLVAVVPTDPAPLAERRRIIAPVKNNLAKLPKSLAFRLVCDDGKTVHVEWLAAPSELTANDLLSAHNPRNADALEGAVEFLRIELDEGARPEKEIEALATAGGIKLPTLRRARKKIRVRSFKKDFSKGWFLALPGDEDTPDISNSADAEEVPF